MLTHDVRVAFSPKSMVVGLTISKDGSALAWSEKNGTLKYFNQRFREQIILYRWKHTRDIL